MKKTITQRLWNLVYSNGYRFTSVYGYKQLIEWRKLKNKYNGKRAFLIANGPSLNITPLYLLKNEYTMVFNHSKLMLERFDYIPSFYMLTDGSVGLDIKDEIAWWAENNKGTFVPDIVKGEMVWLRKALANNNKIKYLFEEYMPFSNSLPFVKPGATVIFEAFQVLRYLGFSEIVVVGNDMNYVTHQTAKVISENVTKGRKTQQILSQEDDDPNHFDPRYFGKGKTYHQPTNEVVNRIFANLDEVASEYKKSGTKIVNAGYNSKVESFPKQDFYECLGYTEDKIDGVFEELVISKGFESLSCFLSKTKSIKDADDLLSDISAVPVAIASDIIKKNILDYLPIGPYKGNVYLINRNLLKSK